MPGSRRSNEGVVASQTLRREEHMRRRARSTASGADECPSSGGVHVDLERGGESRGNSPPDAQDVPEQGKADSLQEYTLVLVPHPAVNVDGATEKATSRDAGGTTKREVPISCAICLSEYEAGEDVCWSGNAACTHVFHRECVVEWLVALGRRKSSGRRFRPDPREEDLIDYPLECPCCRQEFVYAPTKKTKMSSTDPSI